MTDDLTDIELAAEAAANERISWAVVEDKLDGFCFPLNIDAFIALANPARLLALVTELRGLRARNAELEKHVAWRATMDDRREDSERSGRKFE